MEVRQVPYYQHIYDDLLKQIQSGTLAPGDNIPTEKELEQHYNVSRAPVRQALSLLEAQGYIRRMPGRGTEVLHPQVAPWANLSGFAHYYNLHHDKLNIRVLSVDTVPADDQVAQHFGIANGELVLRISRLRLIDAEPVALIHNYFSNVIGTGISDYGNENENLHQLMKRILSREEAIVKEELSAVGAPFEVAQALQISEGSPVMFVTRHGWDNARNSTEFTRYWARTDTMKYRTYLSTNSV